MGRVPVPSSKLAKFGYLAMVWTIVTSPGCQLVPELAHRPVVHNPFPQLSRVAVAPFFNLSAEPSVDGRQFAIAYFHELQSVPGFEVVPVGVVEQAMVENNVSLANFAEARRLAQILHVDAVVVGAVTDFEPYFPPRCTLRVEWYAANPCFHPIPPGYALPWGTPDEEQIPDRLVLETEMALARAQLETQTPLPQAATVEKKDASSSEQSTIPSAPPTANMQNVALTSLKAEASPNSETLATLSGTALDSGSYGSPEPGVVQNGLPPDWPDPHGLKPTGPLPIRPECLPSDKPVLSHSRSFHGTDQDFLTALDTYHSFRVDPRAAGTSGYLYRMPDFIAFCCHYHIYEMLSSRGGADQTQVVCRWEDGR